MTKVELRAILVEHAKYLQNYRRGKRARFVDVSFVNMNLSGMDFRKAIFIRCDFEGAKLKGVDFRQASLRESNLKGCDFTEAGVTGANFTGSTPSGAKFADCSLTKCCFRNTVLRDSDFSRARGRGLDFGWSDLSGATLEFSSFPRANFRDANLTRANLFESNLSLCNFSLSNLTDANLRRTGLKGAIMKGATLSAYKIVPESGSFHAFKKVNGEAVLELLIPKTAKRTSTLIGRKCRASKVKVLRVVGNFGKNQTRFRSLHDPDFKYVVGGWSEVPDFDPDIRVECTRGIHFYLTLQEARKY